MMARQKGANKRRLHRVNEHFESLFNAASAAFGVSQDFYKIGVQCMEYTTAIQLVISHGHAGVNVF